MKKTSKLEISKAEQSGCLKYEGVANSHTIMDLVCWNPEVTLKAMLTKQSKKADVCLLIAIIKECRSREADRHCKADS